MPLDVVDVIVGDHRRFEELLDRLTSTAEPTDRRQVLEELAASLAAHFRAEEAVIYPVVRAEFAGGGEVVRASTYQHLRIAGTLERLRTSPRDSIDLVAACRNLALELRFHLAEEEDEWLDVMRRRLDPPHRQDLAQRFIAAKHSAVTAEPLPDEIRLGTPDWSGRWPRG